MAISLELIHPSGLISLRNWTFENESVIRIGRERENHIVLHSKVVSRFHAMLWGFGDEWKIVNLSCNGTYLDGTPVTHALLADNTVIQFASSGPRLRFRITGNKSTRSNQPSQGKISLPADVLESNRSGLKQTAYSEDDGTVLLKTNLETDKPKISNPIALSR